MKTLSNITSTILIVVLVLALGVLAVPRLFGVQNFAVLSGSMEPQYSVGDLIFTVPTEFEAIQRGDTITFVLDEKLTVVTHQVIEIDQQNESFVTQGTANNTPDPNPVKYKNVVGVVKFSIPQVGFLLGYLSTTTGKIVAGMVLLALIAFSIIFSFNAEQKKTREAYVQRKGL